MPKHCDVSICINGDQTFFLNQKTISAHSGKLKELIRQEKRNQTGNIPVKNTRIFVEINDFPGGSSGFELISRFCYNNGGFDITVSNVCVLYCCAVFLGLKQSLLRQIDSFLEGIFYWSLDDVIESLKSCALDSSIFGYADSIGLLERLICALLAKIAQNSDSSPGGSRIDSPRVFPGDTWSQGAINFSPLRPSDGSSDGSRTETRGATNFSPLKLCKGSSGGARTEIRRVLEDTSSISCKPRLGYLKSKVVRSPGPNPDSLLSLTSSNSSQSSSSPTATQSPPPKQWWFDDLSSLPPLIIEKLITNLGSYGEQNNSIVLTRFILHYLKKRKTPKTQELKLYGGLVDTLVHGLIASSSSFSCRALLQILKTVSGFGLSKTCRGKLEGLIGSKLDEATLDDVLISGQDKGDYYDVKLVLRLIRVFVNGDHGEIKMKKVGRLVDKYLAEIAPDHSLKSSKIVGVAMSLPDSARDCFDGVYKAIDMFLQSHPTLTFEERTKICKCINFEKLSLEACKEMAKNPKIPPTIAIQALKSQTKSSEVVNENYKEENEDLKMNIERMQSRVLQLEKACKEMKGQMSLLVRQNDFRIFPTFSSPTRLC